MTNSQIKDEDKKDVEVKSSSPQKKEYVSFVDEMKKHIRFRKNIYTNVRSGDELFKIVISTMRHIYSAPNKDFSLVGSQLMIEQNPFTIKKYIENKEITLTHKSKDNFELSVTFYVRKRLLSNKFYVRYFDHAVSPKTLWGAKATLGKYLYTRNAKFNFKKIKEDIKNQIAGKERVSLEKKKRKL